MSQKSGAEDATKDFVKAYEALMSEMCVMVDIPGMKGWMRATLERNNVPRFLVDPLMVDAIHIASRGGWYERKMGTTSAGREVRDTGPDRRPVITRVAEGVPAADMARLVDGCDDVVRYLEHGPTTEGRTLHHSAYYVQEPRSETDSTPTTRCYIVLEMP